MEDILKPCFRGRKPPEFVIRPSQLKEINKKTTAYVGRVLRSFKSVDILPLPTLCPN